MRVALGADQAGLQLKDTVKRLLDERQVRYTDFGTTSEEADAEGYSERGRNDAA